MARVAVLGSGIVGSAAAWDLHRRGHDVVVADADPDAATTAAQASEAEPRVLDASRDEDVADLFRSVDLVVSGLPYRFGFEMAIRAVDHRTHYLDFGGNPTIVARQLELDAAARDNGIAIVPDCGLAPGMANVLAAGVIDKLGESIDELRIRVGALPSEPTGALGYQLAFNPAGLINEYAEPCEILRDGDYAIVEPLTGIEEIDWDPFGTLEAFHTAGGSSTLPHRHRGRIKELDYKTLRYPGHGHPFRAMLEIGLFDESPDPVTGVAPRETLLRVLADNLPRDGADVVLVRVWGRSGDDSVGHEVVDRHDGTFSALARTTAFPTTALAHVMLTEGIEPGARAMDAAMTADQLIAGVPEVGITIDDYAPAPAGG